MSRNLKIGLSILLTLGLSLGAYGCGLGNNVSDATDPTFTTDPALVTTDPALTDPNATDPATDPALDPSTSGDFTDAAQQPTDVTEPANASPADFPSPEILRGEPDTAAQTYTGLRALPQRPLTIADPNNSSSLPLKKIEHAYGVAKDGKPHQISVDFQKFFEDKHYAAVTYDNITTAEKPIYLTFDCGYENGNTAIILDVLKEKGVKAAFFCTVDEMTGAPDIVARMINEGHIVGNHSLKHPSFSEISRSRMAEEIIGADNFLRENFGYSAPFFRFPKGDYNESALEAVASLGFTSVFWSASYADWDTSVVKGAQYAADTVLSRLHPGAILLLHSVSADNAAAMGQIIDRAREQGYVFRELTTLPMFHT